MKGEFSLEILADDFDLIWGMYVDKLVISVRTFWCLEDLWILVFLICNGHIFFIAVVLFLLGYNLSKSGEEVSLCWAKVAWCGEL